ASTKLTINDYAVAPDGAGNPIAVLNNPKFGDSWVIQDFISTSAAAKAVDLSGTSCLTPSALISNLTVTGLSTSNVQLDLVGCSSQTATMGLLDKYAQVLLVQRSADERSQMQATINAINSDAINIKDEGLKNLAVANLTKAIGTLLVDLHGNGPAFQHTPAT